MNKDQIKQHFEEIIDTTNFDEVRYCDSAQAFLKGAEWMQDRMNKRMDEYIRMKLPRFISTLDNTGAMSNEDFRTWLEEYVNQ